ncbi:nucleotidyltransferase family protein [Microseira wollei]|uniref:DNA polymerase beta domain protein region n=1 Tax=Microseira wollei NIES-4236 TaxID=2530354 RepID=A0AAV3XCM8_9CYAN|nr:nucleotidyltransferase domain-containing protein [Microseira wollei]GET39148.1 DNA polymerase beta domain protein region [Microseira wollei NIES-4236]
MNDQQLPIDIPLDKITDFCQGNQISKLSLFGSVLRDDFRLDSDVDILIELRPGKSIGFLGLAGWEIELTEMIGRQVDLRFPEELSRYFRQKVLDSAQVIYVHR